MTKRSGFTLLEIMVSMVILTIAMLLAWQTFSAVTRSWTKGRIAVDKMQHGDFVMSQLSSALRSMAFFEESAKFYGFHMEDNSDGDGDQTISWVTAHKAFIPRGNMAEKGMHRIQVGAGKNDDGDEGLLITVWPHFSEDEDAEKQSWIISEEVTGLSCQVYNTQEGEEGWEDEWESSNSIPGLVAITLYANADEDEDPLEFHQLIEIPLGPGITNEIEAVDY